MPPKAGTKRPATLGDSTTTASMPQPSAEPTTNANATLEKGYQRRPDLTQPEAMPTRPAQALSRFLSLIEPENSDEPKRPVADLHDVVSKLLTAPTPDQRLKRLSRLNESAAAAKERRDVCEAFVTHVASPLLFSPELRYLHKGILNVLRNQIPDAARTTLPANVIAFLTNAQEDMQRDDAARVDRSQVSLVASSVVNTLDTISVLVAPAFVQEFSAVAPQTLPLLEMLLTQALESVALRNASSADGDDADIADDSSATQNDVHATTLDHLRFVIRTATTLVHKFIDSILTALSGCHEAAAYLAATAKLFTGAAVMLSYARLPKDLLNAAGLLVATALSLRTPPGVGLPEMLSVVSSSCEKALQPSAADASTPFFDVKSIYQSFGALMQHCFAPVAGQPLAGQDVKALIEKALCRLSCNGALALQKGLLSHVATGREQSKDVQHAVALVCPPCFTLYDSIAPSATQWTTRTDRPDTRFVAVQTVDAAVRHVVSVMQTALERHAKGTATLPAFLSSEVHVTKLQTLLGRATDTVLAMWDDPSQRVVGPLYETYEITLQAYDLLQRVVTQASGAAAPYTLDGAWKEALGRALLLSDDRRGKFQTMSALIPRLGANAFVEAGAAFVANMDGIALTPAATNELFATRFVPMILGATTNNKVSNLVGDVLCVFCKALLGDAVQHANSGAKAKSVLSRDEDAKWSAWDVLCLRPIAAACVGLSRSVLNNVSSTRRGDRGVPLGFTEKDDAERRLLAMGVITHVVLPLLRQGSTTMLRRLLTQVTRLDVPRKDLCVAVTLILSRARGAGVDVSSYVTDASPTDAPTPSDDTAAVRTLLAEALHLADNDLRLTAVELLCLDAKGAAPVTELQSVRLHAFVDDNLSLGGDSTFRNRLCTVVKKWAARLVASVTGTKVRADAGATLTEVPQEKKALHAAYSQYVTTAYENLRKLITTLWDHHFVGDFSVDRKYAALTTTSILLSTVAELYFPAHHGDGTANYGLTRLVAATRGNAPLPTDVVNSAVAVSLLVCLDAGWDKLRQAAAENLDLVVRLRPELVGTHVLDTAAIVDRLRASQLRRSEGGVLRATTLVKFVEASTHEKSLSVSFALTDQHIATITSGAPPHHNILGLAETVLQALQASMDRLNSLSSNALESWRAFSAEPIHGLLGLLSGCLARLGRKSKLPSSEQRTFSYLSVRAIESAIRVFTWCTSLVGQDTLKGASATVDCRGHVYDTTGKDESFEKNMRVVVNNSWLGVRTATGTLQQLLQLAELPDEEAFPPRLASAVGEALITTLLASKHNGVIAKCRLALRELTATLLNTPHAAYSSIPRVFMSDLLFGEEGVQSNNVARMLRRSQGLPHTLLPMLDAEDPSLPPVLVPLALEHLVKTARGAVVATTTAAAGGVHTPGTADGEEGLGNKSHELLFGVNALNVLKFVFDDSRLASRVSPYLEPALLTAAEGFRHTDWFVRNSSLMLFTSAVRRVVGDHPVKGGSGVSSTLGDLVRRLPVGSAFLIDRLTATAAQSASSRQLQPEVYPLLLLLSLLRPDGAHAVGNVLSTNATVPDLGQSLRRLLSAIEACLKLDGLMIRFAAANAFASLVPAELIVEALHAKSRAMITDQNSLHGTLAVYHRVLRAYVGWEHDGTPYSRAPEGLRIRESPLNSGLVRGAVTEAVLHVAKAALLGAAPCNTELWLILASDVLYTNRENASLPAVQALATLITKYTVGLLRLLQGSDAPAAGTDDLCGAACRALVAATFVQPLKNACVISDVFGASPAVMSSLCNAVTEAQWTTATVQSSSLLPPLLSWAHHHATNVLRVPLPARLPRDIIALGQLESALHFMVAIHRSQPQLLAASPSAETVSQACFVALQSPGEAAHAGVSLVITHQGVRVAALTLLSLSPAVATDVLAAIRQASLPHCPLEIRFAAAQAISDLAVRQSLVNAEARVKAIFAVLLLCFDDDATVRRQAYRASAQLHSDTVATTSMAPADCLRRLVALAETEAAVGGSPTELCRSLARQTMVDLVEGCPDDVDAGTKAAEGDGDDDGVADDEGEGEGDDGTLFEVEGENMFVEASTLRRWLAPFLAAPA